MQIVHSSPEVTGDFLSSGFDFQFFKWELRGHEFLLHYYPVVFKVCQLVDEVIHQFRYGTVSLPLLFH